MRLLVFCNIAGILLSWAIVGFWKIVKQIVKDPHFVPGFTPENVERIFVDSLPLFPCSALFWFVVFIPVFLFFRFLTPLSKTDGTYAAGWISTCIIVAVASYYLYN